ncbi:MAG: GLEYA domain-containing protein, partial [Chitinophagaceae bacterium]
MKYLLLLFVSVLFITRVHSQCSGTGSINFQRWNSISGGAVSNLTSNANYPNNPASIGTRNLFEMQQNLGNSIGIKMYGFICPPTTGNYTFWISSDNSGELWLSTSANPSGKVRIAYNTSNTNSRQWNKYTTQKSVSIALTSGQKYYVEALMKEANGNDNLAVGWAKPG